ncbi:hypothetical protein OP10G_3284 [Fimbriimonas ginsengisoli Gsoil 348]|uniref:Uncharacterized protein n=1 Tax=Fimbriimonas ginsengisoli Gsoil 348 TaxID=661478 RepID=A0A068NTI3_FIMGI|nr:hypothetical protein OP10G_3284 [Fimbriimonas ginsengisoli Gsoil 348]
MLLIIAMTAVSLTLFGLARFFSPGPHDHYRKAAVQVAHQKNNDSCSKKGG